MPIHALVPFVAAASLSATPVVLAAELHDRAQAGGTTLTVSVPRRTVSQVPLLIRTRHPSPGQTELEEALQIEGRPGLQWRPVAVPVSPECVAFAFEVGEWLVPFGTTPSAAVRVPVRVLAELGEPVALTQRAADCVREALHNTATRHLLGAR